MSRALLHAEIRAWRRSVPEVMGLLYTWASGYTAVFWVLIACAAGAVAGIGATRKRA